MTFWYTVSWTVVNRDKAVKVKVKVGHFCSTVYMNQDQ